MKIETFADLSALPAKVDMLIEGILPRCAIAMIYGQSGVGKTWIANHAIHCLTTGHEWLGHATAKECCGLYVAAEGVTGYPGRVQVWHAEHGEPAMDGMRYLRGQLHVHDDKVRAELYAQLAAAQFRPDLVVVDTAGANAPAGFDDTKADHWKRIFDGAADMVRHLRCSVLFVHHPGHGVDRLRGSYDQIARADVIIRVEPAGEQRARIRIEKARDFVSDGWTDIRFRQVHGSNGDVLGLIPEVVVADPDAITAMERAALKALAQAEHPLKAKEWMTKAGLAERTFYRVRMQVLERKFVEALPKSAYGITDVGRAAILRDSSDLLPTANVLPFTAEAGLTVRRSRTATTSHPFRDGSGSDGVAVAANNHRQNGHRAVYPPLPDRLGLASDDEVI